MRIEFNTVFDNIANEKLSQLYVEHFMEKQDKQYKKMKIFAIIVFIICCGLSVLQHRYIIALLGILYLVFVLALINNAKKKVLPKNFSEMNGVGCPYNVTFGFYDEYFYEKYENSMSISESSIRYEFLKKIVETPDSFVIMSKRFNLFYLPKIDMGYENVVEFSAFCKNRLPYIYHISK